MSNPSRHVVSGNSSPLLTSCRHIFHAQHPTTRRLVLPYCVRERVPSSKRRMHTGEIAGTTSDLLLRESAILRMTSRKKMPLSPSGSLPSAPPQLPPTQRSRCMPPHSSRCPRSSRRWSNTCNYNFKSSFNSSSNNICNNCNNNNSYSNSSNSIYSNDSRWSAWPTSNAYIIR
eukprot:IDg20363t1